MRFLIDECIGPTVANWLSEQGHDVSSIYEDSRGSPDETVLARACLADRIIITDDKDFGEYVFRDRLAHKGVVLLRLEDLRSPNKIAALRRLLSSYADQLTGRFAVVTESSIRIVTPPSAGGSA